MRVRIGYEFEYASEAPLPLVMLVQARPDGDHTTLYESRWSEPEVPIREYIDSFGNHCWRLTAPAGAFRLRYDAVVATLDEPDPVVPDAPLIGVESLPDATLVYTLPSRYIQSDLLVPISWDLFGDTPTTWARLQSICDWVHANVAYEPGSSVPTVSAMDVTNAGSACVATSRSWQQVCVERSTSPRGIPSGCEAAKPRASVDQ